MDRFRQLFLKCDNKYVDLNAGRGYFSLVLVRTHRWKFKSEPLNINTKFRRLKWPIYIPIVVIFGQILTKITLFFYKILKHELLHRIRGHWYYTKLILPPIFAARPRWVFCAEYPIQRGLNVSDDHVNTTRL